MIGITKRILQKTQSQLHQLRFAATDAAAQSRLRRRPRYRPTTMKKTNEEKSEWWIVDGELHEIGENVPIRERFVIPRDNLPNRRRKQLREQFMRRTRLVVKDNEHEPFCKRYMQLYNELRENWERLYWDEGFSKKLAVDHANYDSPEEDDDADFSPYRKSRSHSEGFQEQGPRDTRQTETWQKVNQIRDRFEYDREQRMRDKAFAPMNMGNAPDGRRQTSGNQPFDAQQYISEDEQYISENEEED